MNTSAWTRRLAWIGVFLPFVVLTALRVPEGPLVVEDDYAHYLLHAQAVAEGRDYNDIGFIPTQLSPYGGPRARPPGLPVLLAPAVAVVGVQSPLLTALYIAMALAFVVLASQAVRRREPVLLAMIVGLVSGLQPNVLHFASEPLSDLPFAALVWMTILLCDDDERWPTWRVLALSLAGAAAIAFRLAGVALIPALAVYGLLHFRTQRFRTLVPLLAWCATFWFITTMLPTTDAPITHGTHGEPAWSALLFGTVRSYGTGVLDAQLYPFRSHGMNLAYHLATLALLGIGAVAAIRAYWRSFFGIFTGGYVAMLLVIPVRDLRYLYPLIPVVILLTAKGLLVCLRRALPKLTEERRVEVVAGVAVIIAALATTTQWQPVQASGVAANPDARALFEQITPMARASTVRLLSFKPHVVTLETGAAAMPIFGASPDSVMHELCRQGITHVVVGDLGLFPRETAQLRAATAAYPDAFREEYGNASFSLWRLDDARQRASDPSTCPARASGEADALSRPAGPTAP